MDIQLITLSACIGLLISFVAILIIVSKKGRRFAQLEESFEFLKKAADQFQYENEALREASGEHSLKMIQFTKELSEERTKKQEALSSLEKMTERAVLAESGLQAVTICRDADQCRSDAAPKEPPQQNLEGRMRKHPHDVKYPGTIHMECESAVRQKLKLRCLMGRDKYGHTMERDDLSQEDWLLHAQEEAMDVCVYLERLLKNARKS